MHFPLQIVDIEEALNSPKTRSTFLKLRRWNNGPSANPQELALEKVRGSLYERDTALAFHKRQIAPFPRGCFGESIEK